MREIKFRVWTQLNKMWSWEEMQNGCFSLFARNPKDIWMQSTGLLDKIGKLIYEGDIVLYPDTYTESIDVGVGMMPVAKSEENSFGEVKFQEGTFGIVCPKDSETLGSGFKSFWWIKNEYGFEISELEIIGNIYENPELI